MTSRRRARRDALAPVVPQGLDPSHTTQRAFLSLRGEVRGWFRAGACYRVTAAGRVYGWGEGPDVWAALVDGSFRPNDYGKHNTKPHLRSDPAGG